MINLEKFRIIWDIIIAFAVTFSALFFPYNLIFNVVSSTQLLVIDSVVTLVFLFDLFVWDLLESLWHKANFNVTFKDKQGKFRFDLIPEIISSIPFLMITGIPILVLLRLTKLVKVASMIHQFRHWAIKISSQLTLFFFFCWIALFAHWLSCGWILLRGVDKTLDNWSNYVNAIFWAVTTLTTVGYGNQLAVTNAQKLYTIFAELMGVVVYGYLVGNIVSLLAKNDPAKTRYIENMEKLSVLTKLREIPSDLENRIRNYYIYTWKKKWGYDESEILSGLPAGLKREVSLQLKKEIIEKIPLFINTDDHFMMDVSLMLRPVIATPGEYVIKEGDLGNEMFFVVSGELSILRNGKEHLRILREGDFFGEMALFNSSPRTASIRAETYCDLYALEKNNFDYVVNKYPEFFSSIEKQAILRNETVTFLENNLS